MLLLLLLLGWGWVATGTLAPPLLQPPPNIVFMLVDNMGWGDLGVFGGGAVRGMPTPRIDELAQSGLRLTNFNVEPECTPSRSALMTGRMPIRSGTDRIMGPGVKDGLAPCEYTLAELLSDAGYNTAMYGKWHLGSSQERHPQNQGFDEWFGIPRSSAETMWDIQPCYDTNVPLQTILQGKRGENSSVVGPYNYAARPLMDRQITDRAVAFINQQQQREEGKQPFFLYVPFTQPHTPQLPHPDFANPRRSKYQNVMAEIDANTGRILDALDQAGLRNETIVVFASDNGPETMSGLGQDWGAQSDAGPFRGEFPSGWEGAIRTPCIVSWPGRTQPGRVSNEIVSILDFYKTFATVAGATQKIPNNRAIDSIDQTDFFFGQQKTSKRTSNAWFHEGTPLAVKIKNFKIHLRVHQSAKGDVVQPGQNVVYGTKIDLVKPWIFDIENDPKEMWNLAVTNSWLEPIGLGILDAYTQSTRKFPNIKPGDTICPWDSDRNLNNQPTNPL